MANPPGFVAPLGRSALVALRRAVELDFAANDIDAKVFLGLRYRATWDTSRVVLIDGVFRGELGPLAGGRLLAPRQKKSFNPREIASWPRPVTLSIRGVDRSALDDEDAQTEAQEALVEATLQAIQNAMAPDGKTGLGQANLEWGDMLWMAPQTQQAYGKELLLGMTLLCVYLDRAQATATPTVGTIKGPLLSSPVSGVSAGIVSVDGDVAVVDGLGFVKPDWTGLAIALSGAASSGNNGTFAITSQLGAREIAIHNPAAVAPDANDGAIHWQIVPRP
jgi:hypothetical protein